MAVSRSFSPGAPTRPLAAAVWLLLLLTFVLGAAARPARAQNSWYFIDHNTSYNSIVPADNLAIGFANVSPFTVFLTEGFGVESVFDTDGNLWIENRPTVFFSGGRVQNEIRTGRDNPYHPTIHMSGGEVGKAILLDSYGFEDAPGSAEASRLFMSGGTVVASGNESGGVISFGKRSQIHLSDGVINGPVVAFGAESVTKISGGYIGEMLQVNGSAEITGGFIGVILRVSEGGRANWKGGTLGWNWAVAHKDATLNIFGSNLSMTQTGTGSDVNGLPFDIFRLNGMLADGTPLNDVVIDRHAGGKVNLIGTDAIAKLRLSDGLVIVSNHNQQTAAQTSASFTLENTGTGVAEGIVIESITIGTASVTGLNRSVQAIDPGESRTVTHTINADYGGVLPATVALRVQGRYAGGTFNITRRVTAREP